MSNLSQTTFSLFIFVISFSGFNASSRTLKTVRFAGTYSYGKKPEKERMGTAYIYPETDSTIIFFLDLNKGGPSYNMGQKLGQCIMHGDTGDYFFKDKKDTLGCKLQFVFSKHHLTINTVGDYYECGYGFGVLSDGVFKRRSGKVPAHPPEEMFAAPEDYK